MEAAHCCIGWVQLKELFSVFHEARVLCLHAAAQSWRCSRAAPGELVNWCEDPRMAS